MCMALIMMEPSILFATCLFFQPWTTAVLSLCKTTLVPDRNEGNDKKNKRTPTASRVLLFAANCVPAFFLHRIIGYEAKISLRFLRK